MSVSTIRPRHRYGRRAPKRAPVLRLARFLTGKIPAHPAAVDQLAGLNGGWAMLGNDVAGDCVAVTWANVRRLVTAVLAEEYYPTQDQVWEVYRTQNPGFDPAGSSDTNGPGSDHDGGMDVQTLLEYLVKTGGPDGAKAVAFAAVNVRDPEEVKAAIAIFGYVWTGINVLDINQQQFADGEPWDYVRSSPDDGGHSVVTAGYGPPAPGPLGGDERFITWAEETSFTDAYFGHEVEEAYVLIWLEHLTTKAFLEGIDQATFASDFTALTGKVLPTPPVPTPAPTPAPTPEPSPTPGPDAADGTLAAEMESWLTLRGYQK